jgi:hypothetical protein
VYAAGVVHLARMLALDDQLAEIGPPDVGAVAFDQQCLSVFSHTPAFVAAKADKLAEVFLKREPFICRSG